MRGKNFSENCKVWMEKMFGKQVCLCLHKNCKKWQVFFCTIPNSPGSVLWQRNKSRCQARKLRCMSSANTEQCIFEKMHFLLQRNSLLGGEGTWQFLHWHNPLSWKLLCSLGSWWTSCDSQPAKHRKIHSVSPFWKCIDLVLCEWKGQRMGEETVALGQTPPPCRLVPLPPETMVSPPQPVLANQRMPWISDSSFIYRTGEYDIDLLGHCTQQRGFQKPSFLRVLDPFRWQNNCKFPVRVSIAAEALKSWFTLV